MNNPYWHEFYKPHAIDFEEVRTLCFDCFAIIAASRSMAGTPGEKIGSAVIELFWLKAEPRLFVVF